MPDRSSGTEGASERGGLLQKLPFDKEVLLIICLSCVAALAMLCLCVCCISSSRGTVVMSSVDHLLVDTMTLGKGDRTRSLDAMRLSGRNLLSGHDSLRAGKWSELPDISENEEAACHGQEQIRALGSIPHRPQVLREHAAGPVTCDSIDAATRAMQASSYWSVAESMDTETVVGNSMQETIVDVGNGCNGMKAVQGRVQRMGQLHIADPASEPSQGAIDCEPTVVTLPRSPAAVSSPESVGMRIPAALRWSLSPRSNEPSPRQRTDRDQDNKPGTGSSLLRRLHSAARLAKMFSPRSSNNGADQQGAYTPSPPTRQSQPTAAAGSNMSPPSSQREFVGEEICRTADGNVVTTHVFRRPSPQISPESSFIEDPTFNTCMQAAAGTPSQLSIPTEPQQASSTTPTTAHVPTDAPSQPHLQPYYQKPQKESPPRYRRRSMNADQGVVYACQQYPPSPEAHNEMEEGPGEGSGGVIDILRGSYPPPPNLSSMVPSPTGSVPRHNSIHTSASNQTVGSISVFTAEPSMASLSQDHGPRHHMGPALPTFKPKAQPWRPGPGAASGKPAARHTHNSLEFPQGDTGTTTLSVSTPWHNSNRGNAVGTTVTASSDLAPLSDSGSPYHPPRADSPPPLGLKHSNGDVGVPTPASSRYAPNFQSSKGPSSASKPPLAYLSASNRLQLSPRQADSPAAPVSPRSPEPRPGRPHTLDASVEYQPKSIWSQVTPQEISEGLQDASALAAAAPHTALQHFSGSTASTTPSGPSTPRRASNAAPVSPEITVIPRSPTSSPPSNMFELDVNLPSPQHRGPASCAAGSNPACSPPSQWTLEPNDFGWRKHRTSASTDNEDRNSLAAAVAARACLPPAARRSSGAGLMPGLRTAGTRAMQAASSTVPSTHRSSVTSLDSTAAMGGRLPPLMEEGGQEAGSAALVDAWLTSMKAHTKTRTAAESVTACLDSLCVDAALGDFGAVLGSFHLLGPLERIIGGQGVIQFAKQQESLSTSSAPEPQVALKFYVQPELIRVETAVYGSPTLAAYATLPRTAQLHLHAGRHLQGSVEASLPPCLVMERGISLKEWMAHSRMNNFTLASDCKTAIKALLQLSQCLVALHSSGFVHRDVKPGAVLWLGSEHRWALVNFARAARIGACTPAPCSLAYAAPEVAAGATCTADGGIHAACEPMASPAADAWSLGIIALELFSRARALNVHADGAAMVLQQLQGRAPLSWEREGGLKCLGPLAACVGKLLSRDAAQRPSVQDFVRDATAALERAAA